MDGILHDADTAQAIGPATDEQIEASQEVGPAGSILVDADGNVVAAGSYASQKPGVRRTYVS